MKDPKTRSLSERSRSIGSVDGQGSRPTSVRTTDSESGASGRSGGMGSICEDDAPVHMGLKPKTVYGDDITDMMRAAQIKNEKEVEDELIFMDEDAREEERLREERRSDKFEEVVVGDIRELEISPKAAPLNICGVTESNGE